MRCTMRVAAAIKPGDVAVGANDQTAGRETLRERHEHHASRLGVQSSVARIACDTDDGAPVAGEGSESEDVAGECDALPDRILAREELLCQSPVDDHDLLGAGAIGSREVASLEQRNSSLRGNTPDSRVRMSACGTAAPTLSALPSALMSNWISDARSGIVDPIPASTTPGSARTSLRMRSYCSLIVASVVESIVRRIEQIHGHRENFFRLETGVHLGQPDHRAREQPSAGEQHDRHRHLRDDETALKPLPAARHR